MSVMKVPGKNEPVKPKLIQETQPYQSPVVQTRLQSYNVLATFQQGSRMTGDYYSAVVGRDSTPKSMQDNLPAVYGQYTLIKGLEVRMIGEINHKQGSDATRGWASTFQISFQGVVTPQEGDVFIFDMGDGKAVIAAITSPTEIGSPYTEGATLADLKVIKVLTPEIKQIYDSKVIETLYYDQRLLRQGLKPILTGKEVGNHRSLSKTYRRLAALYLRDFYSTRYSTLLLPMQAGPTYDPFVTNFVKAVFDPILSPVVSQIKIIDTSATVRGRDKTIFDALLAVDDVMIDSVAQKAGIASVSVFKTLPAYRNVFYTGIRQCVLLKDSPYSNDLYGKSEILLEPIERAGVRREEGTFIIPRLTPGELESRPQGTSFIHRVDVDDYYILSEAFYKDTGGQSLLEVLLRRSLAKEAVELDQLDSLASYADKFNNLERFYYVPLIMAMIRMEIGVVL